MHKMQRIAIFCASAAGVLVLAAPLAAAEATRQIERSFSVASGTSISLLNMAGNLVVVPATGSDFRLAATIHAESDSQAEAERLAGLLNVTFDESAARIEVKAKYPLDTYRRYSYPRRPDMESLPWFLEWLDFGNLSSKYDGVNVKIVSQRSKGAPTLFADFRLEVPAGIAVSLDGLIGEIHSTGLRADLKAEIGSGWIAVRDGQGALGLETGSGDIEVVAQSGRVRAETGSGDMKIERVEADTLTLETGSGDIRLVDVRAAATIETGSGDVFAERLVAGSQLSAETGSGDIELAGDLSGVTDLDISTGSGDVTLTANGSPDLRLAISTGSGGISIDLPGARVTRNDRNDLRAEIGAATGAGRISTGSGDVLIRGRG